MVAATKVVIVVSRTKVVIVVSRKYDDREDEMVKKKQGVRKMVLTCLKII